MSRFSIILPVRNGGNYIGECIQSILSQSVKDFDLLILENNSTDNTIEIIESFQDQRIKVYPSEKPLSIEENWSRALTVPAGEYITLIGHDDLLDENYLGVMDELIKKHPRASLYQAHFRYIGPSGEIIGKCRPMAEVQEPADAVYNFLSGKTDLASGFMMRNSDYKSIGGIPPYPNLLFADLELWIQLACKSYLAVTRSECLSYRKHPVSTTKSSADFSYVNSFERLISFLAALEDKRPDLQPAIAAGGGILLRQYCQGITHRMLRTKRKTRKNLKVADIINRFRDYGVRLGVENFEPLDSRSVRMGRLIDSNSVLRAVFLVFKSIYKKPVLKTKE
jgi:glycosyltransferase involved in cell wall biosynthesis